MCQEKSHGEKNVNFIICTNQFYTGKWCANDNINRQNRLEPKSNTAQNLKITK